MRTILFLSLLLATPAHATTGDGCWWPTGIAAGDVLNVRRDRSASSTIVTTVPPGGGPIISGGVDVLDAEARCLPHSAPSPQRWCPVALYGDGEQWRGFVKRRYLMAVECP